MLVYISTLLCSVQGTRVAMEDAPANRGPEVPARSYLETYIHACTHRPVRYTLCVCVCVRAHDVSDGEGCSIRDGMYVPKDMELLTRRRCEIQTHTDVQLDRSSHIVR